jgi:hypothetical protein
MPQSFKLLFGVCLCTYPTHPIPQNPVKPSFIVSTPRASPRPLVSSLQPPTHPGTCYSHEPCSSPKNGSNPQSRSWHAQPQVHIRTTSAIRPRKAIRSWQRNGRTLWLAETSGSMRTVTGGRSGRREASEKLAKRDEWWIVERRYVSLKSFCCSMGIRNPKYASIQPCIHSRIHNIDTGVPTHHIFSPYKIIFPTVRIPAAPQKRGGRTSSCQHMPHL